MRSKPKLVITPTRERILSHAANHFAQRGFNATSLREITRDAKANPASVHYYFSSKAELYLEVIATFRELAAKLPSIVGATRSQMFATESLQICGVDYLTHRFAHHARARNLTAHVGYLVTRQPFRRHLDQASLK